MVRARFYRLADAKYSTFKPVLRLEFHFTCAYCEIWENENGGEDNFEIDHYLPKKHFPAQTNVYTNLVYSCSSCNGYKSHYFPKKSSDPVVLEPFLHEVGLHIDKRSDQWLAKTTTGQFNIDRFRLAGEFHNRRREQRRKAKNIAGQLWAENQALLSTAKRIENAFPLLAMEIVREVSNRLVFNATTFDRALCQKVDSRQKLIARGP